MKRVKICLVVFLCLSFNVALAEVTQFVFKTEPQTVETGVQSKTITIQSQNSSGAEEDIIETTDIVFTSTSSTGQFLSTSGNSVSGTMAKNTSNKNFLYQDLSVGDFVLTITATGRTSGKTFTASQPISIVSAKNTSTSTNNTNNTTEIEDINNNNSDNNPEVFSQNYTYSAHSSPAPLNDTENKIEFEVSAGRSRLTSVGNRLTFSAIPTRMQNVSMNAISYEWSFGDGTIKRGQMVDHAFSFPGDYSVVLNAYAGDKQATSRTKVKVIEPMVGILKILGGIEITNKSAYETNLEGWILKDAKNSFTFPKDTIISHNGKVIFDDTVTNITTTDIELKNPLGRVFAVSKKMAINNISTTSIKMEDLYSLERKAKDIQKSILQLSVVSGVSQERDLRKEDLNINNIEIENKLDQTASVIISNGQKGESLASKIFSLPKKLILSLFSKD